MIITWRLEDRIIMEPLHSDFNNSQDKHVWGCQSAKSVSDEPDELKSTSDETSSALCKLVQVAFGICPEVQEADE